MAKLFHRASEHEGRWSVVRFWYEAGQNLRDAVHHSGLRFKEVKAYYDTRNIKG